MAYKAKRWRFDNAIEVSEYHNARYGAPGEKRTKRRKPTPEEMKKRNQYNKTRRCRHKLRKYCDVNDYFATLTYRRDARPPDMKTAKKHFSGMLEAVRKEYKKRGEPLYWFRNIEVGTKGAWHIHLVINRIPDTDLILKKAWGHGGVSFKLLYEQGEFRELAEYITKTPDTDKRLKEANYDASRNMPLDGPEEKVYEKWKTWGKVRVPKGFYLDPESYHEGVNEVTGYRYRAYTLLRIHRKTRRSGENSTSGGHGGQKARTVC